ncbi:MAG TPA: amino acid carrier protein [Candidatus Babeliales bacterium]|nr:amino acid carrier protein [Candidatus Babeliales bacterium]
MYLESLNESVIHCRNLLWDWPLLASFLGVSFAATIFLYFVQIRYFFTSWKMVLAPSKGEKVKGKGDISPFQAFLNALATGTGNGSIAGIGCAMYAGGPGAAFWMLIAGVVGMALRFGEVFISTYFIGKHKFGKAEGGPIVFLSLLPGRAFLPYVFAIFMFFYGITSGNAMQVNSIGLGLENVLGIDRLYIAFALLVFIIYVILGGAERVLKISDWLTPFKVGLFVVAAFFLLVYHYAAIWPSIILICTSAFSTKAIAGGAMGVSIQEMIRIGTARSINSHEAGLGIAGVLFGSSGSKKPVADSILSMLSVFISNFVVCFGVALSIIASGVWDSGKTGIVLTSAAFDTCYGVYGSWIVTFVSASFGLGVLVAFIFITAEIWDFLTGGRARWLFAFIYCAVTFFGTMATIDIIWNMNDLVNGSLLLMNLYAIAWFMPLIRRELLKYMLKNK